MGEKIGKENNKESKRSENFRTQHFKTEKEYKGGDMEKDRSRLLILTSQSKVLTSFVHISYMWNVFLSDTSSHH